MQLSSRTQIGMFSSAGLHGLGILPFLSPRKTARTRSAHGEGARQEQASWRQLRSIIPTRKSPPSSSTVARESDCTQYPKPKPPSRNNFTRPPALSIETEPALAPCIELWLFAGERLWGAIGAFLPKIKAHACEAAGPAMAGPAHRLGRRHWTRLPPSASRQHSIQIL